ncbi:hypothetical protein D3C76_1048870 [compost metagenome]
MLSDLHRFANGQHILLSAQNINTRKLSPRQCQAPRPSTGGQHQLAVTQATAIVQLDLAQIRQHPRHPGAQPGFDRGLLVGRRWPQLQQLQRDLATQELLGQWGTLVRQYRFITDQQHATREPLLTQGKRRLCGGLPATDDQHLIDLG